MKKIDSKKIRKMLGASAYRKAYATAYRKGMVAGRKDANLVGTFFLSPGHYLLAEGIGRFNNIMPHPISITISKLPKLPVKI